MKSFIWVVTQGADDIGKFITSIAKQISIWVKNQIKSEKYDTVFFAFGIIGAILVAVTSNHPLIQDILIPIIYGGFLTLLIYTLIEIIRSKDEQGIYYRNLSIWSFAASFYLLIALSFFKNTQHYNLILNIEMFLGFILFIYFRSRYLIITYIRHWVSYALLFIALPLIAATLWAFIGDSLFHILGVTTLLSDKTLGWAVLVLSIFFLNYVVIVTPLDRLQEVKVAVYFILAVFSAISYCFFISDFLASYLIKFNIIASKVSWQELKEYIDSIVRWGSLPYLVGAVFGCFFAELVERKKQKHVS